MRPEKQLAKKIIRQVLISLIIYTIPVILMFSWFYIRGEKPWQKQATTITTTSSSGNQTNSVVHFFEAAAKNLNGWGLIVFIVVLGAIELILDLFENRWTKNDKLLDVLSLIVPRFIFGPILAFFSLTLLPLIIPGLKNAFAWIPFGWSLLIIVITVDLSQYWYHRLHHQLPILWRFHRTHHTATYMSVLVNSRQNVFYIAFLSQLYITAGLVYVGFGYAALFWGAFQTLWSFAYHSSVKWDRFLYSTKWLHPFTWVLERVLVTPATHHAHHADTSGDGIGNYKGNFGGILFIWDVVFKTALISRRYPVAYGVSNNKGDEWYAQMFWPIIKSKNIGSELSVNGPTVADENITVPAIEQTEPLAKAFNIG
jgi:sterol desaturase/sphingolipid hydroxylase (fatty acid hydroxylase superfamily)